MQTKTIKNWPLIGGLLMATLMTGCSPKPEEGRQSQQKPSEIQTEAINPSQSNAALWPAIKTPIDDANKFEQKISNLLSRMSIEEKVGQIIQGEIQNVTPQDVKDYHLGSVLNGGGSMPNRNKHATPQEWLDLADAYYEASMDDSDGKIAIPIIWGSDAVHGHNNVIGATIFPHNIGLGAAHNPKLMREIGRITAKEMRVTGIDWTFAPTLAVAQNDQWGRTYESYSENPDIVKSYAGEFVIGLQGEPNSKEFLDTDHVVATAKHWLGDGGTTNGTDQGNADISEQELRDIHGAGYVTALEAGVQTAMASFSSWQGDKMHGHKYLLTDVLKGQMGLDGFVVGDWNGHGQLPGCTNASCAASINAGVDLIMVPEDWKNLYHNTIAQVKSGEISIARLDDAVRRILRVKLRAGLFDKGKPSDRGIAGSSGIIGHKDHRTIARQAVRESLVLLKNNGNILPVKAGQTVLIAGDAADNIGKQSGGWTITWQGTGNENSDFPDGQSIYQGLKEAIEANGGKVIFSENGVTDQPVDLAIVIYGEEPYAESQGDIETLEFETEEKTGLPILKALKAKNIPTVSIFLSGRPLWMAPEFNNSDAFVAAWLPGSEGAGVADVLVTDSKGDIQHDFKGKLSFSWPKLPNQDILNPHHDQYDPLFKLGYGLTYQDTITVEALDETASQAAAGANTVMIYKGRTRASWKVFMQSADSRNVLSGAYGATANQELSIQTADKDIQEDALKLTWADDKHGHVGIYAFAGSSFYDFTKIMQNNGVITFDVKMDNKASQPIRYDIKCGEDCLLSNDITNILNDIVGQGWQTVTLPLACFADKATGRNAGEDSALDKITAPFELHATGPQVLSIANVFASKSSAKQECR